VIGTAMSVTGASNGPLRGLAGMAGLLGTFALALALAGLYGVLSHVVARRLREMGVRVALGATNRQIVRLLVGDGLRPVLYGVLLGLGAATVARMALRPIFLHMVPTVDPLTVALAPAAILAAGWLACYLPARRASRIDPNVALRDL
jgi:putative ABC transport system permease protein